MKSIMSKLFTKEARQIIALARAEARKRQHVYVETEHILFCILKHGSSIGVAAMQKAGLTVDQALLEIDRHIPRDANLLVLNTNLFTTKAKNALNYAAKEAEFMGHDYIGVEHLFLGSLREKEGTASEILRHLGFDLIECRNYVLDSLRDTLLSEDKIKSSAERDEAPIESETKNFAIFSEAARRIIIDSEKECVKRGNEYVTTLHLLHAMLKSSDSRTIKILQDTNTNIAHILNAIERDLSLISKNAQTSKDQISNIRIGTDTKRVLEYAIQVSPGFSVR